METAASARGRFGRRVGSALLAALAAAVPERCVCCDGPVERPAERPAAEPVAWCAACASRAVPLGERVCLDCEGGDSRRRCLRRDHLALLAAVLFGRETGALVRATKYESCPERLSAWRDAWTEVVGAATGPELLVPVPAHPTRVRERGFDVTETWTRTLAALEGLPWARALARSRATPPQAGADRSRRLANVRGAFAPGAESSVVAGRRVALVDDVVTTGATVRAAASALEMLGARAIEIWAFAFDPLE
jgi:predicted amidophosphoribosyltransferase